VSPLRISCDVDLAGVAGRRGNVHSTPLYWHPVLRPRVRKADATSRQAAVALAEAGPVGGHCAPSQARNVVPTRSVRPARARLTSAPGLLVRRQQRPPVALRPFGNTSALAHASSLGSPSHHFGAGVPSSSFRLSSGLERLDGVCPVAARRDVHRHSPPLPIRRTWNHAKDERP
jgi:hypothetical protein